MFERFDAKYGWLWADWPSAVVYGVATGALVGFVVGLAIVACARRGW